MTTQAPTHSQTAPDIEAIRSDLDTYLTENDVSQNRAARGIGRGKSTISQFLSGSYTGDVGGVAEDVRAFLQREKERANRKEIGGQTVVETSTYRRIQSVVSLTHQERDIAVIIGEAGLGKTLALEAYEAEHRASTLRLEVGPEYTTKGLCQALHRATGGDGRGTIYSLMQEVYDKLRGTDTLVVIDQAEILPIRALELCRRLHDVCNVAVVLAGMPRLLANLQGSRGELKQLYSRVGFKAALDNCSKEDIRLMVDALLPDAEDGVVDAVLDITQNTRVVNKLLKRARHIARMNSRPQDVKTVQAATRMLVIPDPRA